MLNLIISFILFPMILFMLTSNMLSAAARDWDTRKKAAEREAARILEERKRRQISAQQAAEQIKGLESGGQYSRVGLTHIKEAITDEEVKKELQPAIEAQEAPRTFGTSSVQQKVSSNVVPSGRFTESGQPIYVRAKTETDVAREVAAARVQKFATGARKLSDTSRVEVSLPSGEKKWVTPLRAATLSDEGTPKYREAAQKYVARQELATAIRGAYGAEQELARQQTLERRDQMAIAQSGRKETRVPLQAPPPTRDMELQATRVPVSEEAIAREARSPTSWGMGVGALGAGAGASVFAGVADATKTRDQYKDRKPLFTTDIDRTKSQEQVYQEIYQPKPTFLQKIKGTYYRAATVQEGEGKFGRALAKVLPDIDEPKLTTDTGVPTRWQGKKAEDILRKGSGQRIKEGLGFDTSIKESKLTGERLGVGFAVERAVRSGVASKLREQEKQITGQVTRETEQRIETRIGREIDTSKIQSEKDVLAAEKKARKIIEEENVKAQKEYGVMITSAQTDLTKDYEKDVERLRESAFKSRGLGPGGDKSVFLMSSFGERLGLRKPFEFLIKKGRKYEGKIEGAKGKLTREEQAIGQSPWMQEQILAGKITPLQMQSQKDIYKSTAKSAQIGAGLIRTPEKTLGMVGLGAAFGVGIPALSAKVSTAALYGSNVAKWGLTAGKAASYGLTGLYAYGVSQKIKAQPTQELKYITVGEELAGFGGLMVGGKLGYDYLGGARSQTKADLAQIGVKMGGREQQAIKEFFTFAKSKGKVKVKPSTIKFAEVSGMKPRIEKFLRTTLPKEQGIIGGTTAQTAYKGSLPKGKKPGDIDIWSYFPRAKAKAKAAQAREAGLYVETFTPAEGRLLGDFQATTYWGKKIAGIPRQDIMSAKSLRIWESKAAKARGADPTLVSYHTMTFYRSNPFQGPPVRTPGGINIVSLSEQFGRKIQGFFTGGRTKDYPSFKPISEKLSGAAREQLKGKMLFGRQRVASAEFALQSFEATLASGRISATQPEGAFVSVMDRISAFTRPKGKTTTPPKIKKIKIPKRIKKIKTIEPNLYTKTTYKPIPLASDGYNLPSITKPSKYRKQKVKQAQYDYKAPSSYYTAPKYDLKKVSPYKYKPKTYAYKPTTYKYKAEAYKYKSDDYLYKPKDYSYKKPYDYSYKYKPYDYKYDYPYKAPYRTPAFKGGRRFYEFAGSRKAKRVRPRGFLYQPSLTAIGQWFVKVGKRPSPVVSPAELRPIVVGTKRKKKELEMLGLRGSFGGLR